MQGTTEIVGSLGEEPIKIAEALIGKYGKPDKTLPNMLVRYNNGNYKRMILYRVALEKEEENPFDLRLRKTHDINFVIYSY